ncbi:MAG: SLBB domain-containing protein [Nitrospirae bacterium]|nr:SLBB domain-containing protein [Nitrospirota bacterium]
MKQSRHYLFLIIFIFNIHFILSNASVFAQAQNLPGSGAAPQALSPEQGGFAGTGKNNDSSPIRQEMINSLKERPEFRGLTPEEIVKGKELLDKQERQSDQESKTVKPGDDGERIKSLFDRYRAIGTYQNISTELRPFGFKFFSENDERSLTPRKDIPVSSDYIVGPGDEVRIMLWGRVNAQYDLVVDRDGNITIPQIGPLQVSGMRFDELKSLLAGQAKQMIGADINVTMGSLKSIQVFVLGEVRRPGSYVLDSFSTITNALLAAGGPTEIGSLRSIRLKRKNKTVAEMDFYDFLLKGDKSQDNALQSGDVVFISTAGPLVGIAGNVRRPAIYELREDKDLLSLFNMSGGLIPSAYTQQIQVERIQKNERQVVIDFADKHLAKSGTFQLQDGDLVKVFPIVDKDVNAVYLGGNVKRPGKYEYKPGMTVKDLIGDTSALLKETYFDYALIKRLVPPGLETQLVPFHLGKLLLQQDNSNNVSLEPQDSVYVFSTGVFRDKPRVTIEGEVRRKGTYDLLSNYSVKDAIMEAGGLTKDASLDKGEIFRVSDKGDISQIYFSVGPAMAEDVKENLTLMDRDRIVIHSIWEDKSRQVVSVDGDVRGPGQYPLAVDMRVSDLIFSSGNINESAYLDEAEVSSFTVENGKSVKTDYHKINLGAALKNDPEHNVLLKPYDRVFVKRIPGWKDERFINVSGEVTFPGRYNIKKGETLSDVLERAGGYTESAYLRGAVFTREDVRKLQQKSLDEMILRLESEIFSESSMRMSAALSGEEIEAKKAELQSKQKFIESIKNLKATGRMSIRLAHLRLLKGSKYDIELENGDSIHVPVKSNVINVVGAVMSRGSFIYSGQMDYKDYIQMAGGYTRFSDQDNVYVLKVDGTARKLLTGFFNWNDTKGRWETAAFGEDVKDIEPGDTIVVPEKLDRVAWLRETKDLTQILYQIAVTAGVAIVLF